MVDTSKLFVIEDRRLPFKNRREFKQYLSDLVRVLSALQRRERNENDSYYFRVLASRRIKSYLRELLLFLPRAAHFFSEKESRYLLWIERSVQRWERLFTDYDNDEIGVARKIELNKELQKTVQPTLEVFSKMKEVLDRPA